MGSFMSFIRDLWSDVKFSRRFQVGAVMWIPLIVTAIVMMVRFGIQHTLSQKYREFKTTFIVESLVQFPDVQLYMQQPPISSPRCQIQSQGSAVGTSIFTRPTCIRNFDNVPCYYFPFSNVPGVKRTSDLYGQRISCDLMFRANTGNSNDEMYLVMPGGWNTTEGWDYQNPAYIRPNRFIDVEVFHEVFVGFDNKIDNWFTNVEYRTSQFADGSVDYNFSLSFRLPFGATEVNWEEDGFDSWFLLAAWGGGFFFFYLLHLMAFGIAKIFLPDDSRLLKAPVPGDGSHVTSSDQL